MSLTGNCYCTAPKDSKGLCTHCDMIADSQHELSPVISVAGCLYCEETLMTCFVCKKKFGTVNRARSCEDNCRRAQRRKEFR